MPLKKDIGQWISHFEKSDAPQFKGKTKEERKNMALAAFRAKYGSLNEESRQLDITDFETVVQAVKSTGHPATVMLVPKWNEIEIITGMNAPDEMIYDISKATAPLGYSHKELSMSGDSSSLGRGEYSEIEKVNGGHMDYRRFEESVNGEKKLTYNDFVRMVRDDMMAGAAPDERPSDKQVASRAKAYYNDYLQGASVDDLFEATKEGLNEFTQDSRDAGALAAMTGAGQAQTPDFLKKHSLESIKLALRLGTITKYELRDAITGQADPVIAKKVARALQDTMNEALMLDKYEVDFFHTKANVYANIEIPSENPTFEDDIQIKGIGKTEEEAFEDLKRNYENYKKTGIHEAKPTLDENKILANRILRKYGIKPIKTVATAIRGFRRNVGPSRGYTYNRTTPGNAWLSLYGIDPEIIDQIEQEFKEAGLEKLYRDSNNSFTFSNNRDIYEMEERDQIDTITMDVPLFIRILEYSREDAQADMDLHDLAEKAIAGTKQQGTLSMDDYDMLVGDLEQIGELSDKADLNKDGKLSSYEKKRGAAIEKAMAKAKSLKKEVVKIPTNDPNRPDGADVLTAKKLSAKDTDFEFVKKGTAGSLNENAQWDYEGKMAQAQLISIVKNARDLFGMIGGNTQLKSWIQSKLTKAEDYLNSVRTYIEGESISSAAPLMRENENVKDESGESLRIGDVVKAGDGGMYQIIFSYGEGKAFLTPYDIKKGPVNLRKRIYFDTEQEQDRVVLNKLHKVMSYAKTKGGFMG